MLANAIIAFSLAIAAGLLLVVVGVKYRRGSLPLALSHAALAVLGLTLLLREVFTGPTQKLNNLAALLFVLALLGGLVLLALRIARREYRTPPPLFVVIMHAVLGVLALVLLSIGTSGA